MIHNVWMKDAGRLALGFSHPLEGEGDSKVIRDASKWIMD
jgi:hypothetical protein